jgi:hypothetical protein
MRAYRRVSLPLLLLLTVGCGRGYQFAPVSGRVLMDHYPLAHAEVRFIQAPARTALTLSVRRTPKETTSSMRPMARATKALSLESTASPFPSMNVTSGSRWGHAGRVN